MALPASGAINLGDVNVELGIARATSRALGAADTRTLYGVASGAIRLAADGYGKSNVPIISYRGQATNLTTATTYTFNNVDIGTPTSNRYVLVCITGITLSSAKTISSVSIAGTNGTIIGKNIASFEMRTFAMRNVTTGTTATISVTFSGTSYGCGIAVYALNGITSITPRDNETSGPSVLAVNVSITVGDVTAPVLGDICIATGGTDNTAATLTLSGGTPTLTKDAEYTAVLNEFKIAHFSGILTGTAAQTYTLSTGGTSDSKTLDAVIIRRS